MKTVEQQRGNKLAIRLKLLNEYLMHYQGTSIVFGTFLQRKGGINIQQFMQELPMELQFFGIDSVDLSTPEGRLKIRQYTNDINERYFEEYVGHLAGVEEEDSDETDMSAEGDAEDSGLDQSFQDIKRQLKADKKAKKITGREMRKRIREARKAARKRRKEEKKANKDKKRDDLKDIRGTFKDEKAKLKADWKSGKITRKEYRQKLKELRKTKRSGVKEVAGSLGTRALGVLNKFNAPMVVMRNAYLVVLKLNVLNQAKKIATVKELKDKDPKLKKAFRRILTAWRVVGGNDAVLFKNVNEGKDKKAPLGIGAGKRSADGDISRDADGEDGEIQFYQTGVEEAAVAAGSSTPLIVTIVGIVSSVTGLITSITGKKDKDLEEGEIPEGTVPIDPETEDALKNPPEGEDDSIDAGGVMEHFKNYWYFYAGGVLLAGIGGFFLLWKRK